MPFRHAARHLSVRGRMAHRRIRRVLATTTAPAVLGPATLWFAALSVVSHAAATWGMVAIVSQPLPDASRDSLVTSRFLYPLMQQRPKPRQERISYVGLGGLQEESAGATAKVGVTTGASPEMVVATAPPQSEESEPVEAFTELDVDITAQRDPESEGPVYPDSLLALKVEGEARVRYVIDSTGHAVPESFEVLETNERAFAEAVREALPRMKFRSAMIGRKAVSQWVEQSFMFKITRPAMIP